jgi:prepilin-type N-terminal cleavage/methylation domain-containing protein
MKKSMRKGFTLVELLIVIVVIGILSAMMMLSSTEAVSSAKAADIVSDLRNIKTAALAYYADNIDEADATNFAGLADSAITKKVWKYLGTVSVDSKYTLEGTKAGTWYAKATVTDPKVLEKLEGRRKTVGISGTKVSQDTTAISSTTTTIYYFLR